MFKIKLPFFAFILTVLIGFLLRVFNLSNPPLNPAEAYYWDWSRHLSFGYFPHPPFVAYMLFLGKNLFGSSEGQLRLTFAVFGTITVLAAYKLAKLLFDKSVAFLVIILVVSSPAFVLSSRFISPDLPLIFFWMLAMAYFWESYKNPISANFLKFGLFLGLGLMSKYQMFFLPVSIILFLVLNKNRRKFLTNKKLYLSFLVAFFVYFPNLIWNSTHKWATFVFQTINGPTLSFKNGISFQNVLANISDFVLQLLKYPDPVIKYIWILPLIIFIYFGIKKKKVEVTYCFLTFFPITLFFSVYSGKKYWFFAGAIGAYILTAYFLEQFIKNKRLLFFIVFLIFTINAYSSYKTVIPKNSFKNNLLGNTSEINWYQTVKIISQKLNLNGKNIIIGENWLIASEFAYYQKGNPQTSAPNGQYLIWPKPKTWQNTVVISQNKNFIHGKTEKVYTPNGIFYYQFTNSKPSLQKDWSLHYEVP